AWATSRWGRYDSDSLSGAGKAKPFALSNGLPDADAKREFHISDGKNALLRTIGARRSFRGPARSGPTMPLFSIPIAIGCVSPKPFVGEWQPAHVLSPFKPVTVSNQSRRPMLASRLSSGRPRRAVSVDAIRPVNPSWRKRRAS